MSHGRRPFACYDWTEEEQDALVQWAALRAEGELSTGPLGMTDVARALGAMTTTKAQADPELPPPAPQPPAEMAASLSALRAFVEG